MVIVEVEARVHIDHSIPYQIDVLVEMMRLVSVGWNYVCANCDVAAGWLHYSQNSHLHLISCWIPDENLILMRMIQIRWLISTSEQLLSTCARMHHGRPLQEDTFR